MRNLFASVLLLGCATVPKPKVPFEEAVRPLEAPDSDEETKPELDAALAHFLKSANGARLATPIGAPMPRVQVRAWTRLLKAADQFLVRKKDASWASGAVRLRLKLETELQTDAIAFGDISPRVAERVIRLLKSLSRAVTALTGSARPVDPRYFGWPVFNPVVSSPYGSRMHPIIKEERFHAGVDLEAPLAEPVLAAEEGTVAFSAWNGAHGKQIELQHDSHWATRYSHLETLLVEPGAQVEKGAIIGLAGATGMATGPHVHFELRRDGEALDPEAFMDLSGTDPPRTASTKTSEAPSDDPEPPI